MAADTQPHDPQPNDLFGRWLAHHEQQTDPGPDDSAGSTGDVQETAPEPRASRRLPAAAVASSAVERDPVIGGRIVPPSNFGTRRVSPGVSSSPVNELDREPPTGWEPILTRSVRKKVEKTEAKHTPQPVDRPSRFQRLKSRLVDAPEPVEEPSADPTPLAPPVLRTTPPVVAAPAPAPSRTPLPTRPPAPAPEERPSEETVRAAVAPVVQPVVHPVQPVDEPVETPTPVRPFVEAAIDTATAARPIEPVEIPAARAPEPVIEREPMVEPEPVVEPVEIPAARAPEPVIEREPMVEPEPVGEPIVHAEPIGHAEPVVHIEPEQVVHVEPDPVVHVEPEPESVDETPEEPAERRSFLSRPKRAPREPRERGRAARSAAGDAARDLVAAKAKARATTTTPEPEPATVTMPAVAVEAPAPAAPKPAKVSKHDQVAAEMPGVYTFAPKRTSRRFLTLAMLTGLVTSAYFVRAAVQTKETPAIGLAAIVVLATAMVWAIRAGASVTKLEIHQGQLEVVQQGGRFVFDMASQYTHVEVHGQPGKHGWKVLFPRRGMAPFTIDGSMVDPDDFMRVLRFFRPELVPH
jgi:hypothetical protein